MIRRRRRRRSKCCIWRREGWWRQRWQRRDLAWHGRPAHAFVEKGVWARRPCHAGEEMLNPRFVPLVWKQVARRPVRSMLTVLGVATAMFSFCAVQAMQAGVKKATEAEAGETTLVVYRQNRYCP